MVILFMFFIILLLLSAIDILTSQGSSLAGYLGLIMSIFILTLFYLFPSDYIRQESYVCTNIETIQLTEISNDTYVMHTTSNSGKYSYDYYCYLTIEDNTVSKIPSRKLENIYFSDIETPVLEIRTYQHKDENVRRFFQNRDTKILYAFQVPFGGAAL